MYTVTRPIMLSATAKNDLRRVPPEDVEKVMRVLGTLCSNSSLGTTLYGKLSHLRSYVVRPYRIVYKVIEHNILVIRISTAHPQQSQKRTAFS